MKANVPKAWDRLPQAQRKSIQDYAFNIAKEQMEKDARLILDLYIKMVCLTLHGAFGFGEKRLTMFLVSHRRLFRSQKLMVEKNTQLEYLDKRMAEIFKKNGFPQDFFDEMLGEVEAPTEEDKEVKE